jgi:hypothetical protein
MTFQYRFVVGYKENKSLGSMDDVYEEIAKYHDIILCNFVDIYNDLPYKAIHMFHWINTYCMNAKYILKIDDDVLLNLHIFGQELPNFRSYSGNWVSGAIFGAGPIRDRNSKWFAPPEMYLSNSYPEYTWGVGWIMSVSAVPHMLKAIEIVNIFYIEDVYTGGLVRIAAGVKLIRNAFICGRVQNNCTCIVCH